MKSFNDYVGEQVQKAPSVSVYEVTDVLIRATVLVNNAKKTSATSTTTK